MILADKICTLRKKNGWSQEELAEKLDVTRQSVSKWEGAQSVPDLAKILQMSKIFGVTTDYLMKDELEEEEFVASKETETKMRRVSMEEANDFLHIKEITAKRIAFATFLCIISPICLFLFGASWETGRISFSENAAAGLGMCVLFVLVAIASAIFISCGMKTKKYEFLEKEVIDPEYGVTGMVKERQKQYQGKYTKYNIIGTVLCILSIIPLFAGGMITEDDFVLCFMLCIMLVVAGAGVVLFIVSGINNASMQKLLQEGEYSKEKKGKIDITGVVSTVYWLLVTAGFLLYSFTTGEWGNSWIIWTVAGVLYAAVVVVCSAFQDKKK